MAPILIRQCGDTGMVAQPRRPRRDMSKWWNDVRWLIRQMPDPLGVERSAISHRRAILVAHPPAAVATFDHVHESRLIAAVAVVVHCEEVAILIKRQLLRIAQASVNDFEIASVGLAA